MPTSFQLERFPSLAATDCLEQFGLLPGYTAPTRSFVSPRMHEARRPSFCNALDKLLRLGCWRSDAHSRGSENENPQMA